MNNERLAELGRAVSVVDGIDKEHSKKKRQEENAAAAARREFTRQKKSLQDFSTSIEAVVNNVTGKNISAGQEKKCHFKDLYISNCYSNPVHFDVDVKYDKAVDVELNKLLTVTLGLAQKGSVYKQGYPINGELSLNIRTIIDVKSSQTGTPVETFFIGDEGIVSVSGHVSSLGSLGKYYNYEGHFHTTGSSFFEEEFGKAKELADEVLGRLTKSGQGGDSTK